MEQEHHGIVTLKGRCVWLQRGGRLQPRARILPPIKLTHAGSRQMGGGGVRRLNLESGLGVGDRRDPVTESQVRLGCPKPWFRPCRRRHGR